ncbi:cyclomaltodextrin glucanotransferase [Alteromonas sp. KC3]|uniref:alpha-amylase family glycosyl hydrolase n=1 Tax=unclassified Alteromonas TaxID=2614992 RepID=UPI001920F307|nr:MULTISPECIES: alpha-amylase family glycosyl hydrolase [unclassified Alteromonas]BCO19214.1 cyclomaltodextrin glucanotransferase [Alteromonas sp. KC3]BCO23174.1 cyclomaltodextrin glucanotransferase [Alteromonas sp. KC14]
MSFKLKALAVTLTSLLTGACSTQHVHNDSQLQTNETAIVGTTVPFASEAVYFVVTDRFVDGDPSNNHEDQGGDHPTWQLPLEGPDGKKAYVGYMGGDLKGILNNADYIADLGFTAVWMTPVVDNPDYAFNGDEPITYGGAFKDGGKTGYHGYWATNFYKADEHLVSDDLSVKDYTTQMREKHGLKSVFDIVANHGSPSFTMEKDLPGYGELYDAQGKLVADHGNLAPEELDPENNPLHAFFHNYPDLVKLSNLDDENPLVRDYLINSYLYWISQGADAFRIDTIRHVPHSFWREASDRIRAENPDFFMFGESFDYEANNISQHTLKKNGGVSVLDFPMQKAMVSVFEKPLESDFSALEKVLYLTHGPYQNPYELTTFYDNHDMARMNATDEGFINAHNWLFTVRGIPVVYMGSEVGYMRGTAEHAGNRNYVGQDVLDSAMSHPIGIALKRIANVRKTTPALQRGIQVNVELNGHKAIFYRVLQNQDNAQTALVLLNKSDQADNFTVSNYLQEGEWVERLSGEKRTIEQGQALQSQVAPNGVQVWVLEGAPSNEALLEAVRFQLSRQ